MSQALPNYPPTSSPLTFHIDAELYTSTTSTLFGLMVNCILYGILWVQFYLYFVAFPKDPRFLKMTVCALLLLEAVQTATCTYDVVHRVILAYTRLDVINEVATIWIYIPLMTGLIASITQWFYCSRIGMLTRSKYAVTVIGMLSLGQLTAAICVAVQEKRAILLTKLLSKNSTVIAIGIWGSCSFACDIVIAAIMTYYLRKGDSGFKNTHSVIVRIVRLSIETGCVTALSAGALVVLVLLPGHPPYYAVASAIVSKTYSNSMMAMLNIRVKPVANVPGSAVPTWNESVKPIESAVSSVVVFRREPNDPELDYRRSDVPGSTVSRSLNPSESSL